MSVFLCLVGWLRGIQDTVCQDLPISQREVSFRGLRDTKGCEGIYLQESAYVPDRACHGEWRGDLSLQRE